MDGSPASISPHQLYSRISARARPILTATRRADTCVAADLLESTVEERVP